MSKNLVEDCKYRRFAYFGEETEKNVTYVASPIFPNKEVRSKFMCESAAKSSDVSQKDSVEAVGEQI